MKNSQSLTINRGFFRKPLQVTAFELTVGQIIGIYYACRKFYFPDDSIKFADFMRRHIFSYSGLIACNIPLDKLGTVEKNLIEAFFYQVNDALFKPSENGDKQGNFHTAQEIYEDFVRIVFNNPDYADLPFSVVQTISDNANDWTKDNG